MAMDFPSSPAVDQQFTSGASTWRWDGTTWNIVPQMGPMSMSDVPPSNPAVGQLWWRSTNGQMYVWYNDGTSSQWVQAAGMQAPGFWEPIETRDVSVGATSQTFLNLGAYRDLRLRMSLKNTVACSYYAQVSENNGTTWIGTNYVVQNDYGSGSTTGANSTGSLTAIYLANGNNVLNSGSGTAGLNGHLEFFEFNKPVWTAFMHDCYYQQDPAGQHVINKAGGVQPRLAADNAFQILATQNFTGRLILEGVRG